MYNGLLHNSTHVRVQSLQTSCLVCSLAPSPTPQLSSLAVLQYHLASEQEWGCSVQHVGFVQPVHNVVYTLYITCTPGDSDTWNLCMYKQVCTYFTICKLKLESKVLWNLEYPGEFQKAQVNKYYNSNNAEAARGNHDLYIVCLQILHEWTRHTNSQLREQLSSS